MNINNTFKSAFEQYQSGNIQQAESICKQILENQPANLSALQLLGIIYTQFENYDLAIKYFEKALELNPNLFEAYHNLGRVLQNNNRHDEAISCYEKALQINPKLADAYYNIGTIFHDRAEFDQAIHYYQKALRINPELVDAYYNIGNSFRENRQFDEAILFYKKALQLSPDQFDSYYNMGIAFEEKGHLDEALSHYQKALQLNPKLAHAYNNLGNIMNKKHEIDKAMEYYLLALTLKPDFVETYVNLGNAFSKQQKFNEAEEFYRHALKIKPDFASCYSNLLFVMNYNSGYNTETIFSEHLQFAKRFEEPLLSAIPPHKNERSLSRRIKIGYVSPDFRRHPVANLIEPVLAAHNKEQFEVFCYSLVHKEDEVTKRLRGYVDHWRNIAGMSDEKAAESIRNDGIDILVDLAGHTGNNKILLFARKPAPVQVTWLGYLATTGLSSIDYHIADKYTDPPGMTEHFYTEKLLRLPENFLCYSPEKDSPGVSKLPALKAGHITFGSFNNFARISHKVISVWSKILQTVPNSRLILKAFSFYHSRTRQQIIDIFAQRGIASERIVLLPYEKSPKYLESYNLVDIGLDTFPCNGGVTTCEALWMGVPVITFAGTAYDSRVGISLLSNIGLPDLVARTPDEYISIAVNLASDLEKLQSLRERLRDMMSHSPLCDAKRLIENLENAYRRIWENWCQSFHRAT